MQWKKRDLKLLSISCIVTGSIWLLEIISTNQQLVVFIVLASALVWVGKKTYPRI